jgi:hypothetical protein
LGVCCHVGCCWLLVVVEGITIKGARGGGVLLSIDELMNSNNNNNNSNPKLVRLVPILVLYLVSVYNIIISI